MKKLTAILLSAAMLTGSFTGCKGKSSDEPDYSGKYEASKAVMNDMTYEGEFNGVPIAAAFQLELNSDGTAVQKTIALEKSSAAHWEIVDDQLKLTEDGFDDPIVFRISGNDLITNIDDEDMKLEITLTKVSEFTVVTTETVKK